MWPQCFWCLVHCACSQKYAYHFIVIVLYIHNEGCWDKALMQSEVGMWQMWRKPFAEHLEFGQFSHLCTSGHHLRGQQQLHRLIMLTVLIMYANMLLRVNLPSINHTFIYHYVQLSWYRVTSGHQNMAPLAGLTVNSASVRKHNGTRMVLSRVYTSAKAQQSSNSVKPSPTLNHPITAYI